jgi:hypothetical protein
MSGDHDRIPASDYTAHRCPDWDGLLINCDDDEYECCTCPQYNGGTLRFTQYETNELIEAIEDTEREWVGLTDHELQVLDFNDPERGKLARAVEAKLKEKNT